jgi:hypothetical protein
MSWRSTDEWPDDKFVLAPDVLEESLREAAQPEAPRAKGSGRRMRRIGKTPAVVLQVALLVAMVLIPAGTFAGKPSSDPAASTTQAEAGKGKSEEAKAKKGATTEEATAASEEAKPGKGSEKKSDPTTKGNGGSKDKSNKPDKANQGSGKKTEVVAETTVSPRPARRPSPATRPTTRPAARSS